MRGRVVSLVEPHGQSPWHPATTPRVGRHPAHALEEATPAGPRPKAVARWRVGIVGGLFCVAAVDDGAAQAPAAPQPVTAELITEHASIQPHGQTRVGVHFTIADGWHIYAQEPGDAGLPTQMTWTSSSHWVQCGPLQWPKPQRFLDPGDITTFGYSGAVVLHSTLTRHVPEIMDRNIWPTNESQVQIRAEVKWLACKAICIPGSATLSLTLPVSTSPPVFSAHAQLFEHIQN